MRQSRKNIWILGASSGIGRSLAIELARRGHCIALSSRRLEELNSVKDALNGDGHLVIPVDVADWDSLCQARQDIDKHWEKIDSLIFMAGIYTPMNVGSLDLNETRQILSVNLMGAFHAVEAVLTDFLKHSHGQIALCGSVAGYRGLPKGQPYGATKAAINNLAESLKAEHGKTLDIKLINPGFVSTRLTDKNDFAMPMKISATEAAIHIANGLEGSKFEIAFPWRFVLLMKILRLLPYWLYFKIVG